MRIVKPAAIANLQSSLLLSLLFFFLSPSFTSAQSTYDIQPYIYWPSGAEYNYLTIVNGATYGPYTYTYTQSYTYSCGWNGWSTCTGYYDVTAPSPHVEGWGATTQVNCNITGEIGL